MKKLRLTHLAVATSLALGLSAAAMAQSPQPASNDAPEQRSEFRGPHSKARHMHLNGSRFVHSGKRGYHHMERYGYAGPGTAFLRGLDLTEEQRDKIFEIRHASAPALREAYKELAKAKRELRALAQAAEFEEARAQQAADAAAKAFARLHVQRAKDTHAVLAVLTPEQRQKLDERKQRSEERRAERRAQRGSRGSNEAAPRVDLPDQQ